MKFQREHSRHGHNNKSETGGNHRRPPQNGTPLFHLVSSPITQKSRGSPEDAKGSVAKRRSHPRASAHSPQPTHPHAATLSSSSSPSLHLPSHLHTGGHYVLDRLVSHPSPPTLISYTSPRHLPLLSPKACAQRHDGTLRMRVKHATHAQKVRYV